MRADFAEHAGQVAIVHATVQGLVGVVGAEQEGTNQNKFIHLGTQRSVPYRALTTIRGSSYQFANAIIEIQRLRPPATAAVRLERNRLVLNRFESMLLEH
jgi:hypothetical protein